MTVGRPSKYAPEFAEQARKLCELGATDVAAIPVTREMREAGASVIEELRDVVSASYLAEQVYIAMARKVDRQTMSPQHDS